MMLPWWAIFYEVVIPLLVPPVLGAVVGRGLGSLGKRKTPGTVAGVIGGVLGAGAGIGSGRFFLTAEQVNQQFRLLWPAFIVTGTLLGSGLAGVRVYRKCRQGV